jgi:hypothetical protein
MPTFSSLSQTYAELFSSFPVYLLQKVLPAMLAAFLEPLPERTGNPEKRVNTEEGKCANQQPGHGPECIIEVRILFPVMVGGMGQITGELPVGTRMAFLAGFHDMSTVQA